MSYPLISLVLSCCTTALYTYKATNSFSCRSKHKHYHDNKWEASVLYYYGDRLSLCLSETLMETKRGNFYVSALRRKTGTFSKEFHCGDYMYLHLHKLSSNYFDYTDPSSYPYFSHILGLEIILLW